MRGRRATTTERGYGREHQALRSRFTRIVAAGRATCARCGQPIRPDEAWDLGHDDLDRSRYQGPEHARCNRATKAHRKEREYQATHSRSW